MMSFTALFIILSICIAVQAFSPSVQTGRAIRSGRSQFVMEYIPDGLSKDQWAAIKKKEAEDLKAKGNLGAMGVNRFRSRSFEAWQKSGAKHLFPVNPEEVPYEERPYMQRRGGDWEGSDLSKVGLEGKSQGKAEKSLKLDKVYEKAKADGKLDSVSIFGGLPLPWTSDAAGKMNNKIAAPKDIKDSKPAVAAKKLSEDEMKKLKSTLFKPIVTKKEEEAAAKTVAAAPVEAKKKGFFGLF